jgi:hypothetical protein
LGRAGEFIDAGKNFPLPQIKFRIADRIGTGVNNRKFVNR